MSACVIGEPAEGAGSKRPGLSCGYALGGGVSGARDRQAPVVFGSGGGAIAECASSAAAATTTGARVTEHDVIAVQQFGETGV